MDLDLSVDGEVRVTMTEYLKNIVVDFTEKIRGRVRIPAAENLFTVREESNNKLLDEDWATALHH